MRQLPLHSDDYSSNRFKNNEFGLYSSSNHAELVHPGISDSELAAFTMKAWLQVQEIENALERHTCNIERAFLFQGREYLSRSVILTCPSHCKLQAFKYLLTSIVARRQHPYDYHPRIQSLCSNSEFVSFPRLGQGRSLIIENPIAVPTPCLIGIRRTIGVSTV
jgi:hypothetical protein